MYIYISSVACNVHYIKSVSINKASREKKTLNKFRVMSLQIRKTSMSSRHK